MPGTAAAWIPFATGMLGGGAASYFVRRARLCSFGATEALWLRGDGLRLRAYALALAVAIGGTQALVLSGVLDLADVRMLPAALPAGAALAGGLLFGVGMALVGTCAFGALLRLGSGDLRALVALGVMGAAAWATLSGSLAWTGAMLAPLSIALPRPDLLGGMGAPGRAAWAAAAVILFGGWALTDGRLRRSSRLLLAGLALGLAVVAGWVATGPLADPFDAAAQPPHSLSFISPVARFFAAMLSNPAAQPTLGSGSVIGAVLGAFLAARQGREFAWEAFDDHREMTRHLLGACAMGVGGVWSAGCTIGQGITAGSLLAPTWLPVVGGILLGARLGIGMLVGDGLVASWRDGLGRLTGR